MKKVVFTTPIKIVTAVSLLVTILVMASLYVFVVAPKQTEVKAVEAETAEIMRSVAATKSEKQLLAEQPGLYESEVIKGIPSEIEVRQYFTNIQQMLLAKGAKVSMINLEEKAFYEAETDKSKVLQLGTYTFEFSGETKEILFSFVEALESDSRFIRFNTYTYTAESVYEKEERDPEKAEETEEKFKLTLSYDVFYLKEIAQSAEEQTPAEAPAE